MVHKAGLLYGVGLPSASHRRTFQWQRIRDCSGLPA